LARNRWPIYLGISGRLASEYAPLDLKARAAALGRLTSECERQFMAWPSYANSRLEKIADIPVHLEPDDREGHPDAAAKRRYHATTA